MYWETFVKKYRETIAKIKAKKLNYYKNQKKN
jgi:hypothetical protein